MADLDPFASPAHLLGAMIRHWRQDVRGIGLRALADEIHWSFSLVAKWERGELTPDATVVRQLDTALDAGGFLIALASTAADAERLRRLEDNVQPPEDTMERRAAMQLMAGLSAGAVVPSMDAVLTGVDHALGLRDEFDLDDWEQVIWEYRQRYVSEPSGTLIGDLTSDLVRVSSQIGRDPSHLARPGLLRISAQLAMLLARALFDSDQWQKARRAFSTARRAADASGDRDLRVLVRAQEAGSGFFAGKPVSVLLHVTDEALAIADESPSAGLALAYSTRARALASRGNGGEAHVALECLTTVCERLPAASGSFTWETGGLSVAKGYVYALLGDRRASDSIDHAFALLPRDAHGPVAGLRLIHALSLIHDRQVDEGVILAAESVAAWPLSAERRMIAGQVLSALPEKARDLPAARELRTLVA